MGIFRTNDPTQFDDIDGIIIDEQAPPPSISGVAANVGILVGQFERGPSELSLPLASIGEFHEIYGKSAFSGNKQLKNKKFGRLRLIRVTAAAAVKATLAVDAIIQFTAKYSGAYGNLLKVTVEVGSNSGSKYTIQDDNPNAVLPVEIFDDVEITGDVAAIFAGSKLVDVAVLDDTSGEPTPQAITPLAAGSEGTVADTDYEAAIALAEEEKAGNVLFLDSYNATRNGYLKTHVATTQDKMCIVCGAETDDRAAAIADAANYRDSDGRIIYGWPYVQSTINGVQEYTSPASWIASIFTQVSPHVALSYTANTQFLAGINDLKFKTGRNGYISLDEAGVCALERDLDVGFLVKNAVTTQIVVKAKREILRRRMADFLQDSIAFFLKTYQNAVNSNEKRDEVKGAILEFDTRLVNDRILPGEQDVKDGAPVIVDTESLNTDAVIADGMFKILYRRRIFSSMRYIVLQAEIGTNVIVTEGES